MKNPDKFTEILAGAAVGMALAVVYEGSNRIFRRWETNTFRNAHPDLKNLRKEVWKTARENALRPVYRR